MKRRDPTHPLSRSEGSLLIVALLFLLFATTAIFSTMGLVTERTRDVRTSGYEMVAREAALSGVHQTIATLETIRNLSNVAFAFRGIDLLDGNLVEGPGGFTQTLSGQVLLDGNGRTTAETDVFVDVAGRAAASSRIITISAYAYVPSKADYAANVSD